MLVDDLRVFTDFTVWLHDLLEARGVPAAVLRTSLHIVAATLPPQLPRTRAVLERGLGILDADIGVSAQVPRNSQ